MLTKEYDVNIYVIDNLVKVLCYEMETDETGIFIATNTIKDPIKLEIPIDSVDEELKDMIGFLLGNETYWDVSHEFLEAGYEWMDWWEEHDEWTGMDSLITDHAPKALTDWIDSLPYYDAKVSDRVGM